MSVSVSVCVGVGVGVGVPFRDLHSCRKVVPGTPKTLNHFRLRSLASTRCSAPLTEAPAEAEAWDCGEGLRRRKGFGGISGLKLWGSTGLSVFCWGFGVKSLIVWDLGI